MAREALLRDLALYESAAYRVRYRLRCLWQCVCGRRRWKHVWAPPPQAAMTRLLLQLDDMRTLFAGINAGL